MRRKWRFVQIGSDVCQTSFVSSEDWATFSQSADIPAV
jgi:hypothetical protein